MNRMHHPKFIVWKIEDTWFAGSTDRGRTLHFRGSTLSELISKVDDWLIAHGYTPHDARR